MTKISARIWDPEVSGSVQFVEVETDDTVSEAIAKIKRVAYISITQPIETQADRAMAEHAGSEEPAGDPDGDQGEPDVAQT